MSFVEFLLEYYIFILAVLIVLIVGVIGYLVDSKNKEKKQDLGVNVANSDTATLEPSKINIANPAGVVGVNNMSSNNIATNFQEPMVDDRMLNVGNFVNNINTNNSMISGMVSGQNVQPVVSNLGVNMGNEQNNMISAQSNVVNNTMNKQSVMDVNLNNVSNNIMSSNLMYGPQLISPMGYVEGKNVQSNVQNSVLDSIPIQPVQSLQYQVNEKKNNDSLSNNAFNLQNQIGVQSGISVVNPILVSGNNSMSNNGVNSQLDGQNRMMNVPNVQGQDEAMMNQSIMSDNSLNYGIPVRSIQNTNTVGQYSNNNGSQNDNVVLGTDGSKPFDISNMFVNNQ